MVLLFEKSNRGAKWVKKILTTFTLEIFLLFIQKKIDYIDISEEQFDIIEVILYHFPLHNLKKKIHKNQAEIIFFLIKFEN